jgi:Zn-dependent protease with chaperone function
LIDGKWHDKDSAAHTRAVLRVDLGGYSLSIDSQDIKHGSLQDIAVSDRLGNIERKLTLGDGSVFSTFDNDAVDAIFKQGLNANSLIHILESNVAWVLVALVLTIGTTFSFFKWGVPWAGTTAAHALPQKTNDLIGGHTLEFLDDFLFEPSELEEFQQTRIRDHFFTSIVPLEHADDRADYTLHFRAWGEGNNGIPNALALPSGDIILTDKFVELSQSQDEIDSVLLHEMGHVEHRHSLETIIQSTLMTTVVVMLTGELSGIADIGVGVGSLLLSTAYSRDNESEADQYAFESMLRAGIDPNSFAKIMERMSNFSELDDASSSGGEAIEIGTASEKEVSADPEQTSFLDYLSTHPSTEKRIEQAKRYAHCYQKGFMVCDYVQLK